MHKKIFVVATQCATIRTAAGLGERHTSDTVNPRLQGLEKLSGATIQEGFSKLAQATNADGKIHGCLFINGKFNGSLAEEINGARRDIEQSEKWRTRHVA